MGISKIINENYKGREHHFIDRLYSMNLNEEAGVEIKGEGTPQDPTDAICLALYIRYLKRICAHLRNIASSIVNPFHRIGYREKNKNNLKSERK